MKNFKVILLIGILLKSVGLFSMQFGNSCCAEPKDQIELACGQNDDSDQQKSCCSDGLCICICCGLVFIEDQNNTLRLEEPTIFNEQDFAFSDVYFFDDLDLIWHPPKNV